MAVQILAKLSLLLTLNHGHIMVFFLFQEYASHYWQGLLPKGIVGRGSNAHQRKTATFLQMHWAQVFIFHEHQGMFSFASYGQHCSYIFTSIGTCTRRYFNRLWFLFQNNFVYHYTMHVSKESESGNSSCKFEWNRCIYCGTEESSGGRLTDHMIQFHGDCCFQCAYCLYRAAYQANVVFHEVTSKFQAQWCFWLWLFYKSKACSIFRCMEFYSMFFFPIERRYVFLTVLFEIFLFRCISTFRCGSIILCGSTIRYRSICNICRYFGSLSYW